MIDLEPFGLTLRLAACTTLVLLAVSLPLAAWLAFTKSKLRPMVAALVSMPLVLPPSVLGFYFLTVFSPGGAIGGFLDRFLDIRLVFTFSGLVVASVLYGLPFMVQPIQSGLASLPAHLSEASYILGKGRGTTFFKVLLPNIRPSMLTAVVLTFAHVIGEFGVVLMIGGSIPAQTRVASIAVYDAVEALNYHDADVYAGILFAASFLILFTLYWINGKKTVFVRL